MQKSPLFGRRIHIAGSIDEDLQIASKAEVENARAFVKELVSALVAKGATFVVPVDAEKLRSDGMPICFDWLIWEALTSSLVRRPTGAPNPIAIAVQHHKTEDQVPSDRVALWDGLRGSELLSIDNASQWNMASKRMEIQALRGEVLLTLGGGEGVLYLANLYHQSGKPVIPLGYRLCAETTGSRKLFNQALTRQHTSRFFRTEGQISSHDWINRLNFSSRHDVSQRVSVTMDLLESLARPTVFAVRLLNPAMPDFNDVEDFFSGVVQPFVEQELGYKLDVVDGKQAYEHARIDAEIFSKLHHSAAVVADITGERPNCFTELGYALARGTPLMMTAKKGTNFPFDVATLPGFSWDPVTTIEEKRRTFKIYWQANINRPSLIIPDPLIP